MRTSIVMLTGLILSGSICSHAIPAATADDSRIQKRFGRMDANSDGRLDAGEIDAIKTGRFQSFDWDYDGFVGADVIAERWISNARRRGKLNKRRRRRLVDRAVNLVRTHDANGDRKLSLTEYKTIPRGFYLKGDADGDGVLTFEEYKGFIDRRRSRRKN